MLSLLLAALLVITGDDNAVCWSEDSGGAPPDPGLDEFFTTLASDGVTGEPKPHNARASFMESLEELDIATVQPERQTVLLDDCAHERC
jgi:hypothetical protein